MKNTLFGESVPGTASLLGRNQPLQSACCVLASASHTSLLSVGDDVVPRRQRRELRLPAFTSLSRLLQLLRDEAECRPGSCDKPTRFIPFV